MRVHTLARTRPEYRFGLGLGSGLGEEAERRRRLLEVRE